MYADWRYMYMHVLSATYKVYSTSMTVIFTCSSRIIMHMYIIHACTCRVKQPEYQHHRESIGAAKTLEQIEDITAEIKSSLLV